MSQAFSSMRREHDGDRKGSGRLDSIHAQWLTAFSLQPKHLVVTRQQAKKKRGSSVNVDDCRTPPWACQRPRWLPRTARESCHCERSEAISHCCTEIAAHPTGATQKLAKFLPPAGQPPLDGELAMTQGIEWVRSLSLFLGWLTQPGESSGSTVRGPSYFPPTLALYATSKYISPATDRRPVCSLQRRNNTLFPGIRLSPPPAFHPPSSCTRDLSPSLPLPARYLPAALNVDQHQCR